MTVRRVIVPSDKADQEPTAGREPQNLLSEAEALNDRFDEIVAGLKRRTEDLSDAEVINLINEALAETR